MTSKYSFHLAWSDEDEAYIASCPEFPGLLAHGDTPEEAIREAGSALELSIETYNDNNLPLPEAHLRQAYSGQFRLRLPKSLHRRAALMAEREGVSLNAFAVAALAEKVGVEKTKAEIAQKNTGQYITGAIFYVSTSKERHVMKASSPWRTAMNTADVLIYDNLLWRLRSRKKEDFAITTT
jgi:antitoxin HicB